MLKKLMHSSLIAILCTAPTLQATDMQSHENKVEKTNRLSRVIAKIKQYPKTSAFIAYVILANVVPGEMSDAFVGGNLWPISIQLFLSSLKESSKKGDALPLSFIIAYSAGLVASTTAAIYCIGDKYKNYRSKKSKENHVQKINE